MPASTAMINGVNYAWKDIIFVLFGIPVVGITKINYKRKQNKENNYGAGSKPISRGYGNYEYEGSIEIYMEEWKKVIAAAVDKDPMTIPPFNIQVLYGTTTLGTVPTKDVLKFVEFLEDPFDIAQGATKHLITIPLLIGDISKD